jgi:flagella basal body P-ring formation protein FlgA
MKLKRDNPKILSQSFVLIVVSVLVAPIQTSAEGYNVLNELRKWISMEYSTEVELNLQEYDVDLRKLSCEKPIQFSAPEHSQTLIKAECVDEWRRFIKIPLGSIRAEDPLSDSQSGWVALVDLKKGDQVLLKHLELAPIGRGAPSNLFESFSENGGDLFAQRDIRKGSFIRSDDLAQSKSVYAARSPLLPMASVEESSFKAISLNADVPKDAIASMDNLRNFSLARRMSEGEVLRQRHLQKRKLVSRGDIVNVQLDSGAFSISARATALEDGYIGDTIRARNQESGRILQARVMGPGQLEIEN